jgi:hypothetical protein
MDMEGVAIAFLHPSGTAELSFTARVQRGPSEAARCASTKDTQSSRLHPCFFQHLPGIRLLRPGYFLRRSFRHDLTALIAAFRSEVNDPIRILEHIEIMFITTTVLPASTSRLSM